MSTSRNLKNGTRLHRATLQNTKDPDGRIKHNETCGFPGRSRVTREMMEDD